MILITADIFINLYPRYIYLNELYCHVVKIAFYGNISVSCLRKYFVERQQFGNRVKCMYRIMKKKKKERKKGKRKIFN